MIYFARQLSTGYIKIGYSVRPFQRMLAHQKKFPDARLFGLMSGQIHHEHGLHRRFEAYNVARPGGNEYGEEWFFPAPTVLDYINSRISIDMLDSHLSKFSGLRFTQFINLLEDELQSRYRPVNHFLPFDELR